MDLQDYRCDCWCGLDYIFMDSHAGAGMKTTIELDNRDWGKVAVAIQRAMNYARSQLSEIAGDHRYSEHTMRLNCEIATLARIKASLANQRKAGR